MEAKTEKDWEREWDKRLWMTKAMRTYGGSFVIALAECIDRADQQNLAKLRVAFPEYWAKYNEIGATLKAEEAEL